MCRIWCEDRDGITGRKSINGSLIRIWVANIAFRISIEGDIEAVVDLVDVLFEMFADCWVFASSRPDHAQLPNLSSPSQIEESQSNNADLFIRSGSSRSHESCRVLPCADLSEESVFDRRSLMAGTDHQHIDRRHI